MGNSFLVEALGSDLAVHAFRRLVTGEMTEAEILSHVGRGTQRADHSNQLILARNCAARIT